MGFEDAQDRGYGATAGVRPDEWPDYIRGYRDGEKQLAENPKAIITNYRTKLADAERRLALAVAEVKAWRAWADVGDRDSTFTTDKARAATDADPELAKMIGGEQ
jgi:hypothetical protein